MTIYKIKNIAILFLLVFLITNHSISYPNIYPGDFQPVLQELGCTQSEYDITKVPGTILPSYVYGILASDAAAGFPTTKWEFDTAAFVCFRSQGEYSFAGHQSTGAHFLLVLIGNLERQKPIILQTLTLSRSYPGGIMLVSDNRLDDFRSRYDKIALGSVAPALQDQDLSGFFVFVYDGIRFIIFRENNEWYFQAWD